MKSYLVGLLIVLTVLAASCSKTEKVNDQPYLIVLSMDGFRWDYPDYYDTPVLDSLQKAGVKAESLKPSYPTKTFPNHYTIATGLYPDHHGIVGNSFHALDLGLHYYISNREAVENGEFYGGEPIWVTAEKQNVKSATLFWVGSEAEIKSYRPSIWLKYDHNMPFTDRIDTVIQWLSLPEKERPRLIMWYVDEPDSGGHEYGPLSDSTKAIVENLDALLGQYFTQLRKLPFYDQLNFIITSDHGMAEISEERVVFIDQHIDTADIMYFDGMNPFLNIKVKDGKLDKVYDELKKTPHIFVWKHDSLPERLHYGTNPRTQDLSVVAYPSWSILTSWRNPYSGATHGYDNDFLDMHAIFYGAGPAFKVNYSHPTFDNIDIYPLMSEILKITPAPADGKIENVKAMLK